MQVVLISFKLSGFQFKTKIICSTLSQPVPLRLLSILLSITGD